MARIISERTMDIHEELCACFTDSANVFDRTDWTKLMQVAKYDLSAKLYMDQGVKLKLGQGETRRVKIGRGVR